MPATDQLLLDTHVWLWTVEGVAGEMSPETLEAIEAASREGRILVSAISVWEVGMLEARNRISLSQPIDDWVRDALRAPGVRLLRLTPEIAVDSTRLPAEPPGDPADRILLASARVSKALFVTRDRALLAYGESGHVRAMAAGPSW